MGHEFFQEPMDKCRPQDDRLSTHNDRNILDQYRESAVYFCAGDHDWFRLNRVLEQLIRTECRLERLDGSD